MYTCDNLPENTFAYHVTAIDLEEVNLDTMRLFENIARRFNVDVDSILIYFFNNLPPVSMYPGDIIPIPGAMPLHHFNPCDPEAQSDDVTLLDMTIVYELLTIIDALNLLSVAYLSDPTTINYPYQNLFEQETGRGTVIGATIGLAGEVDQQTYDATLIEYGFDPNNLPFDPAIIAATTDNRGLPTRLTFDDWTYLPYIFDFDSQPLILQVNQMQSEATAYEDWLDGLDTETIIDNLITTDALPSTDPIISPNRDVPFLDDPVDIVFGATFAVADDQRFEEMYVRVEQLLNDWNAEVELAILERLENIYVPELRERPILNNISVQSIIDVFQNFTHNMRARHDALVQLQSTFDYISWLRLTGTGRMHHDNAYLVINRLAEYGIDVSSCLPSEEQIDWNNFDWASFESCVIQQLQLAFDNLTEPSLLVLELTSYLTINDDNTFTVNSDALNAFGLYNDDPYIVDQRRALNRMAVEFAVGLLPVVGWLMDVRDFINAIRHQRIAEATLLGFFSVIGIDEFFDLTRLVRTGVVGLNATASTVALNATMENIAERVSATVNDIEIPTLPDGRTASQALTETRSEITEILEEFTESNIDEAEQVAMSLSDDVPSQSSGSGSSGSGGNNNGNPPNSGDGGNGNNGSPPPSSELPDPDEILANLGDYQEKHRNKHLPDTAESRRLIRKGSAHVFNDRQTMDTVVGKIIEQGEFTGIDGNERTMWARWGMYFDEPIGYRIDNEGNQTPLTYGEIKVNIAEGNNYHAIPRTRPRRT